MISVETSIRRLGWLRVSSVVNLNLRFVISTAIDIDFYFLAINEIIKMAQINLE